MPIKCLAIDDEPLALRQMSDFITKTKNLAHVASCNNAFEAIEIMNNQKVDLLFVDINMPDLNGLDFVKSLNEKPGIIFTTAHSEYAIEGFKVDAIDYLLKPIGYPDFLKAVNKAVKLLKNDSQEEISLNKKDDFLFLKTEYRMVKINIPEIKYIEGMREYVRVHTVNDKPIMSLISMKSLEAHLPSDKFMRVHRSYIVNLERITVIERSRIIFDNDVYIPVSDHYKEKFQQHIDKYFPG